MTMLKTPLKNLRLTFMNVPLYFLCCRAHLLILIIFFVKISLKF
jgi:hypothetical protein